MKILRLDLLAFGPFTRQQLTFGDEGLHIVYGPNEAGKSSTLRALQCLLYGFPPQSPDAFVHPYKDLRVGALLRGKDGVTLECIRRKGNRNTLRDADDAEIIDESQLSQLLGGISKEVFTRQFAIDHAQLVAGGQEVVAGGGEIGQILFAAASGFAQLNEVRRSLAAEAETLFTPAAVVKPINRAIAEYKQRRQAAKESQLSSNEWKRHREALAASEERKKELEAQQRELSVELARLQRIQRALPDIARRQNVLDELRDLGEAPRLPADFSQRRRSAELSLNQAELLEQEAETAIAELTAEIDGLELCEAVLARQDFIEPLRNTLAVHLKAEQDSRVLIREREQLLRDAREILQELGHADLGVENAEQLRLSREDRLRIQRLGAEYAGLIERVEHAERRLKELQTLAAGADEELAQLPSERNVAPLQRALQRLRKHGDLSARCLALEQQLARTQKQAQVDLKKLPLWEGSLEALEVAPIPCIETIAEFERRLDAIENECAKLAEQQDYTRRQLDEVDQRLQQLDLQHDVPTEEDLATARTNRDNGWRLLRARLNGNVLSAEEQAFLLAFPGADSLENAYEQAVQQADNLADRLRREAERVGEKSQLLSDRTKLEKRLENLTEELKEAVDRRQTCQEQWRDQWRAAGIEPLSPREMRGWLARQTDLLELAATLRSQADELEAVKRQIDDHCRELHACLEMVDVYPEWHDPPLDDLVAMCEATVEEMERVDARRQQLERDRNRHRRELELAADELHRARDLLQQWRCQWSEATQRIRLQADSQPAVALEVLGELDTLFAKIREADSLTERIQAIQDEAARFAQNVRNVCEGAAPDLVNAPYGKATTELYQRLEAAKKASIRREDLEKQRNAAQKRREAARRQRLDAQAQLETLCKEARCNSPSELLPLEEQAQRHWDLGKRLEELENRLHQEAAGKPLEKFIEEATAEDPDQLPAAVEHVRRQLEETSAQLASVNQTIGEERKELENMDGNARAAEAQEAAEQLLAQIRDDAERYVRLRLAAEVLHHAIQRHREKNQGPVLARASELFQNLTLGSFVGLRVDYDDAAQPVLVGQREGGQTVTVQGMSDGSCDQLYLALRLASLEHYLDNHSPLPFIVDDILITFDDNRSVAALRALAELSGRTQVIFFTHHRRLVDLARKHLPKRSYVIHELPDPLGAPDDSSPQAESRERTLFA